MQPQILTGMEFFVVETEAGSYVVVVQKSELPTATLTTSERQVLQLALGDCSNAQMAARRDVSARTIVNQLSSIYRKLEVRSRRELKARFTSAVAR